MHDVLDTELQGRRRRPHQDLEPRRQDRLLRRPGAAGDDGAASTRTCGPRSRRPDRGGHRGGRGGRGPRRAQAGRPRRGLRAAALRHGRPGRAAPSRSTSRTRPVAAGGEKKVRRTVFILLDGLVLLWAALFRLMAGASRRLRKQAEENRRLAREDGLTGLANRTSFTELAARRAGQAPRPRRRAAARPRPLQGPQRLARPPRRRPAAARDRPAPEHGAARGHRRRPPRRRRVRRAAGARWTTPTRPPIAAKRVREVLSRPVEIEGIAVSAEGSVGIAALPGGRRRTSPRCSSAPTSPCTTPRSAASGVSTYQPDADRSSHERLLVLAQLREAIENDELVLHYQPKISLTDERIVGAEALVRWQHPERGLVGPVHFVPLAEHTGLIGPLTAWVLERALRDARGWWDRGHRITVAVNLSVANLVDPELPGLVARLLAQTRLPPSRARVRDHRERADDRAREGAEHPAAAARDGRQARRRRLRHRPLVARLPAPAAAQHAQDRPLVRGRDGARGRRHRPLDRRPRPLARPRRRRRGHRGRGDRDRRCARSAATSARASTTRGRSRSTRSWTASSRRPFVALTAPAGRRGRRGRAGGRRRRARARACRRSGRCASPRRRA